MNPVWILVGVSMWILTVGSVLVLLVAHGRREKSREVAGGGA